MRSKKFFEKVVFTVLENVSGLENARKHFHFDVSEDISEPEALGLCKTKSVVSFNKEGKQRYNEYELTVYLQNIHNQITDNKPNSFINRNMKTYLDGMGLEVNINTIFVLNLIHELGHVMFYERINKYMETTQANAMLFSQETMLDAVARAYEIDDDDEHTDFYYSFTVGELFADKFAFERFPGVWQKVKHLFDK